MGSDFEVVGRIIVDSSGAVGLESVDGKLKQIGEHTSGLGGITQRLGGIMNFVWGNLIARGIEEAARHLVDFVKDSISAAQEEQVAQSQLAAVIKSTGGAAGYTQDQINQLAGQYAKLYGFEDDLIVKGETMLLQFTKIGHDVLPKASEAAMDLARRTGMDLPRAFQTVGRALAMPEQGIGRLNMAYKLFDKDQLDVIKNMAKGGDVAGAQALILDALSAKIGGAAKAYGETYAGRLAIFNVQVQELKESIGYALLPVLSKLITLVINSGILDAFKAFFEQFKDGKLQIAGVAEVMKKFGGWWEQFGPPIVEAGKKIWDSIQHGITIITPLIRSLVDTVLAKLSKWAIENGPLIDKFIGVIAWVFTNVLVPAVTIAIATIIPLISGIVDVVLDVVKFVMQIITGDWSGAWDTAQKVVIDVWNALTRALRSGADALVKLLGGTPNDISKVWSDNWNQFVEIVKKLFNIAVDAAKDFIGNFVSVGAEIVSGLIRGVEENIGSFIETIKDLIQRAITAALNLLGIQSPSRVFAAIGRSMMEGMGVGIGDGLKIPITALTRGIPQLGAVAATGNQQTSYYGGNTTYSRKMHFGAVNNFYVSGRATPADTVKNLRRAT